jgi:hypothetical protein
MSSQMNSSIQQFRLTLPNHLLQLLQLTRNINYVNQFISGRIANFHIIYYTNDQTSMSTAILGLNGFSSQG